MYGWINKKIDNTSSYVVPYDHFPRLTICSYNILIKQFMGAGLGICEIPCTVNLHCTPFDDILILWFIYFFRQKIQIIMQQEGSPQAWAGLRFKSSTPGIELPTVQPINLSDNSHTRYIAWAVLPTFPRLNSSSLINKAFRWKPH